MSKTIEEHFRDWESECFGFGYGTGEIPILAALKVFADTTHWNDSGDNYTYDYKEVEKALGETSAWLLINALCKDDSVGYGTSPRFGSFYGHGKKLVEFLKGHTVDELYAMTKCDQNYTHCFRDYCSCGDKQVNKRCPNNPFWERR